MVEEDQVQLARFLAHDAEGALITSAAAPSASTAGLEWYEQIQNRRFSGGSRRNA
jgi:hypothetical protein